MPLRVGSYNLTDIDVSQKKAQIIHFPFEISIGGSESQGWFAQVRPGTVNQLVPANIFDVYYIDKTPDTAWYIKLLCQTDGQSPNYLWIYADTSGDITDNLVSSDTAPPQFTIFLGVIRNSSIYQIVSHNLNATPTVQFLQSKVPSNPGEEPFVRWWGWTITDGA